MTIADTVTAELQIRGLIARYSDAVWRLDRQAYADCWAPDGIWRLMGQSLEGRETIVGFWVKFMTNFATALQTAQTLIFDIGETTGIGRIYVDEVVRMTDNSVRVSKGVYHDRYVLQSGQWLFALRHFDLVYFGPPDFTGRFFDTIPYGRAPQDPDPSRPATPSMDVFMSG